MSRSTSRHEADQEAAEPSAGRAPDQGKVNELGAKVEEVATALVMVTEKLTLRMNGVEAKAGRCRALLLYDVGQQDRQAANQLLPLLVHCSQSATAW